MMVVRSRVVFTIVALTSTFLLAGCQLLAYGVGQAAPDVERSGGDRFPDVLEVRLEAAGDRRFDIFVTMSSPYDSPSRYADGWRVIAADGTVLGTHTLLHDHANEQPFTRVQTGVLIPAGVDEVTVQGRDQANGFGGLALTVPVPDGP